jgi:hypothetical protein
LEKEFSMTGMNLIAEPQRQTPIVAEVDVAAIGGGTALAAQLGVTPRKLDVALLQQTLREQGANV